jgi:hypothetical protein
MACWTSYEDLLRENCFSDDTAVTCSHCLIVLTGLWMSMVCEWLHENTYESGTIAFYKHKSYNVILHVTILKVHYSQHRSVYSDIPKWSKFNSSEGKSNLNDLWSASFILLPMTQIHEQNFLWKMLDIPGLPNFSYQCRPLNKFKRCDVLVS